MDQLLLPPTNITARLYYEQILKRSLYVLGYRQQGFRLLPQPHVRLKLPQTAAQPDDYLEQPCPAHIPLAQWLTQDQ